VDLVCRAEEADAINRDGAIVRFPVDRDRCRRLVAVDSRALPGALSAGTPGDFEPDEYDLVALAMQEPQYRAADVRLLLRDVARARVPCLSLMNMPPLPYLARIPNIDGKAVRRCYADAQVWDDFDPELVTLCSPDAQAVRVPNGPMNELEVRLATNLKAAAFAGAAHTELLRLLERDIEAVTVESEGELVRLPVKLRVHDSPFVPLAKWCMLLTGNYRCLRGTKIRSIGEAVHDDLAASRAVYEWVAEVCRRLGAGAGDLVPFEKYAAAAKSLTSPSSAARALAAGARDIERVDRLVQLVARDLGLRSEIVDALVARVDEWLARNRGGEPETRAAVGGNPIQIGPCILSGSKSTA
jgi:hypothetical protein